MFGVLVMVLAVLVSVAIVVLNGKVASVDELPMFAPLMCVGMALIALGMLSSMLRPSPAKRSASANQQPTVARCPFSGATATLPPQKKAAAEGESETEEDEDADGSEKRVSRCPFGFG